ncbi:Quinol monooxygenase YgiN [Streptosporangium subroseum]|uniref:Quinol monooxygenase YgiN n=1 Tax=Streptosporangium subroseum TaxID=106412 RepID=A0A239KQC8_9ACTN|nr:antibiotic biosynthesis monooxygenase family protein [Streptosporangium subroseum]SNT19888.1 Quinol monooxygenase YgiN [Streptosporangium subroseum]
MSELRVIARLTISDGNQDKVLLLLRQITEAVHSEPGNISFVPHRQLDDDREVVILERYVSREAFTAHQAAPHFQHIVVDQIFSLLDKRVVESYDVAE